MIISMGVALNDVSIFREILKAHCYVKNNNSSK